MFKLGWFIDGYSPKTWLGPWAGNVKSEWPKAAFWQDAVRALERGGFDLLFMEDTSMIDDTYKGSMEVPLQYALEAPKADPMPLMPLLADVTDHIGLVPTISTIQYHPYLAARLGTTLDHLTGGRIGFNIVTSVSHRVAQNFGYDEMLDHDERYQMAGEWMNAVSALWESWEPGAVVHDQQAPRYADHTKVHPVNFAGKYFKTRGPLNMEPGPQRRPVIAQAGTSDAGRNLAATEADVMLSIAGNADQMIELRRDMNRRLIEHGRDPDDLHILFLASVFVGWNDRDAQERHKDFEARRQAAAGIEQSLWLMSYLSGGVVDYSTFDLDEPMPRMLGNGQKSTFEHIVGDAGEKTLYEVITGPGQLQGLQFVGALESVAEQMHELIQCTGGRDGYLIHSAEEQLTRKNLAEITDGLCHQLRVRGYIRDGYRKGTFRENLHDWW
jgi:FMN-dependent oxidoreductase (nitrilotriacetate monooxygenase family)